MSECVRVCVCVCVGVYLVWVLCCLSVLVCFPDELRVCVLCVVMDSVL